ncbi:Asp23/Gls24 family envelope stress response protein [Clostridium formicaceticum]|uniref:Alkaline shock protein 23 n=1 Tax=Clostridium formicaceticum TaxID=1497 RepID=A0AAC9RL63_9CLOT|nr:Asp23/Gls24 family envelope stress response protein [Clostridium formicaceticum]AOY77066.1 alkaline-shock protein [Clostridium formicaceticum]ARE87572.1 Alkaline shock protein 23 [Clostridium formicaceticum]
MDAIEKLEYGEVKVADEVLATIAGIAATEVIGVCGMSGGLADGIAEILGKKNLSKGVRIDVTEEGVAIDLYLIVDYGVKIPELAWKIQDSVKTTIESMIGTKVIDVNIHIQGVNFPKETIEEAPVPKG